MHVAFGSGLAAWAVSVLSSSGRFALPSQQRSLFVEICKEGKEEEGMWLGLNDDDQ